MDTTWLTVGNVDEGAARTHRKNHPFEVVTAVHIRRYLGQHRGIREARRLTSPSFGSVEHAKGGPLQAALRRFSVPILNHAALPQTCTRAVGCTNTFPLRIELVGFINSVALSDSPDLQRDRVNEPDAMAQHDQLDVLIELTAAASDEQPQDRSEREVGEREKHPSMPLTSRARPSVSSDRAGF